MPQSGIVRLLCSLPPRNLSKHRHADIFHQLRPKSLSPTSTSISAVVKYNLREALSSLRWQPCPSFRCLRAPCALPFPLPTHLQWPTPSQASILALTTSGTAWHSSQAGSMTSLTKGASVYLKSEINFASTSPNFRVSRF